MSSGSSTETAAPPTAATPVIGFFHGGVTVSDLDAALAFYVGQLGLEVHRDWIADAQYLRDLHQSTHDAVRIAFLQIPGSDAFIELLEYRGIERYPAAARPFDPGSGHLCLFVADVGAILARLRAAGVRSRAPEPVTVTAGPNTGARLAYVADPDGYWIELFQRPSAAAS